MKTFWGITARACLATCLAAATLLTAGCISRYRITLSSGGVITTHSKPKLDKQQGVYRYKDLEGRPAYIPAVRVQSIEPLDEAQKQGGPFIGTPH